MKQTSSTICMNQNNCFSWIADVSKLPLSNLEKKWNGQFHMGGYQMAVAVHTALALNVRMGEFCSMPHKLGWPYWAVCMSGLVMALVIFRSSLASLMGPWGPINSPRACVQDRKAPKILLRSLVLQRFPDKKFTRPPDYHRLTSPSAMWCRKGCHKECLQS